MHELEYYVVALPKTNGDRKAHIEEALMKDGLNPSFVQEIDPSELPEKALQPPKESPFKGAFQHILKDPENPLHPIIHALEEGGGRARIIDIAQRGNGVPRDFIENTLEEILRGHVVKDPEDPEILVCPYFTPKDGC